LEHIGFGTTGTDEEGKYTNDKLEEQNRGPAKLALNQKSSATIETVFDANDPNSVGICPGDSGGFLGSRVGGQSYISGIHSSASTTQLKFNDVACRFENYVISNASATSVNLYSASAQSFLNQITKSRSLEICGLNTSVPSGFASTQRPSDGATRVGQTVGASGVAPNGAGSASGTAGSGRPPVTGGNTGVAGGPSVGSPMPATLPAAKTAGLGFSLVDSPSIRITKAAPEGFAASKMGLQPGDKIIGWDGLPLAGGKDFIRRWQNLLSNPQKNSVVLTIQKADGTLKRFGIKFPVARSSYDLMARKSTRLGLFIEDEPNRASVAQISNSGMGGELRLGQGDVLLSVNDQKVTRSDEAAKAIEMAKSSDEEFKLGFLRPDGSIYSVFMDPKKIKTNPNFVATR
jgi:S1-C subfamily serine protease